MSSDILNLLHLNVCKRFSCIKLESGPNSQSALQSAVLHRPIGIYHHRPIGYSTSIHPTGTAIRPAVYTPSIEHYRHHITYSLHTVMFNWTLEELIQNRHMYMYVSKEMGKYDIFHPNLPVLLKNHEIHDTDFHMQCCVRIKQLQSCESTGKGNCIHWTQHLLLQ